MQFNHTAAFYTLGCKLNFAETSSIARDLEDNGFAKIPFNQSADLYVINTCSVTDNADKKCRNIVRKALNNNPNAFVVVVGCYAQLKPKEISQIPGVDLVLGAKEKFNVSQFLGDLSKNNEAILHRERIRTTKEFIPSWSAGGRTRSFLKVQDGCDYFCSFCTIPIARGKSRSGYISDVVKNATEIASKGIKEVVLTGVNIGDFKNDREETFLDLIKELDKVTGIDRFRISSIEPNLLSEEIIDFVQTSRSFMPHFHIPLQSGSDILLSSMRRKYNTALYRSRIQYIKDKMPNACIGVDVIVGYPGETDIEFLKTVDFIKSLDVSYLHVFTYSERNNTLAKKIEGAVNMEIRKKRSKQLRMLSLKLERAFYQTQIGQNQNVLFEVKEDSGQISGYSENYVRVTTAYDKSLVNKLSTVYLKSINASGVMEINLIHQATAV